MENILIFFKNYGLVLTIIAISGIALLGVLKYCNTFSKLKELTRHLLYLSISIGFSLIASAIYLLIVGQFSWDYFAALSVAIYVLNQTFYNIFKVTKFNDLCVTVLNFIKSLLIK